MRIVNSVHCSARDLLTAVNKYSTMRFHVYTALIAVNRINSMLLSIHGTLLFINDDRALRNDVKRNSLLIN